MSNTAMKTSCEELAGRLRKAYSAAAVAPLRDGLDALDVDGAYDVQNINTRHWVSQGRRIVGRKIGLTAKAVQTQLGVDRPDYGVLFNDMAIPDGGTLFASKVLQPKAEAEVALVMARDLTNAEASIQDVLAATAYALPAIEIVDSRIADWKITFADTVADNGSSAFFVLGREPCSLARLDLETCGMVLEQNDRVASMGVGAACLGHPLIAAAWLIATLGARGEGVRAGDIVLTGALGPMIPIRPGDVLKARIGGLGSCGFTFVEDRK
jgi:2-keto-4-pentenoate hydratase